LSRSEIEQFNDLVGKMLGVNQSWLSTYRSMLPDSIFIHMIWIFTIRVCIIVLEKDTHATSLQ
jgi:hypothetical protein